MFRKQSTAKMREKKTKKLRQMTDAQKEEHNRTTREKKTEKLRQMTDAQKEERNKTMREKKAMKLCQMTDAEREKHNKQHCKRNQRAKKTKQKRAQEIK